MKISLNGNIITLDETKTLADLFEKSEQIDHEKGGIAVAVNDTVIPKADWASCKLREGDSVEVIQAVQGG